MTAITAEDENTHWLPAAFGRGLLWLIFLGPFFFLTYGFANQHAAQVAASSGVGSLVFAWERGIPFWPWTIIPYWSIDLLYGLAFLCCRDKQATNRLGLRLLSAQIICIACFLLWPLHFSFVRPPVEGVSGALFAALANFDLPYNQAPSLHIALLVIIWRQFAAFVAAGPVRWLIHAWALLIGLSVLTTWQHHFIDLPTGFAVGLFCLWLWPEQGKSPLRKAKVRRPALALRYFLGAALFCAAALSSGTALGGIGLLLCWPALALALVAFNYAWAGAAGFQKHEGWHALAARWLFAPYTLAAWINSRLWTRRAPAPSSIGDGVWLGRLPTANEFAAWAKQRGGQAALFDLTAELPAPRLPAAASYIGLPCLDLTPVSAASLSDAVRRLAALQRAQPDGAIWIACALGVSRSASVAAAWLCAVPDQTRSVQEAVQQLQSARPHVVLGAASIACLEAFRQGLRHAHAR
ncbi:MAG: phosphatase PAP2/dual specificity phosphatase family protein [Azonexus sp.]|uniref:phosphatase PAP2/dual specificity phosphatase family protein n=1 Tax=Azonexus sp. TaxID=1872668 RepID=UPI00283445E8|nr:phosphatase PAP2/dual specificity phosphatase family protein [Azonexus sp.]MDR0775137.1 phosphatase PAP2/dual specificity phosphatase family protein [Azonexus sp.]